MARNGILFTLPMALFAVAGFAAIPILVTVSSVAHWSDIVVAQSIGGVASVITSFGWGATGPIMIGSALPGERRMLYWESLVTRLSIFVIVLPIALLITFLLTSTTTTMALATLGASIPGLAATWYFTGEANPRRLLLFDTVPRISGMILGLAATFLSVTLWPYLVLAALGALSAVSCSAYSILHDRQQHEPLRLFGPRRISAIISGQYHGAITTVFASAYANAPVIIVQAIAPTVSPDFNMAFKLMRYGAMLFLPLSQSLQGWVPKNAKLIWQRLTIASRAAFTGAAILAVATTVTTPALGALLSHGEIGLQLAHGLAAGFAVFFISGSQFVGLTGLMVLGRGWAVASSTVAGALFGVPLIVLATHFWNSLGALWAVAFAEMIVLSWQLLVYRRARREHYDDRNIDSPFSEEN